MNFSSEPITLHGLIRLFQIGTRRLSIVDVRMVVVFVAKRNTLVLAEISG